MAVYGMSNGHSASPRIASTSCMFMSDEVIVTQHSLCRPVDQRSLSSCLCLEREAVSGKRRYNCYTATSYHVIASVGCPEVFAININRLLFGSIVENGFNTLSFKLSSSTSPKRSLSRHEHVDRSQP